MIINLKLTLDLISMLLAPKEKTIKPEELLAENISLKAEVKVLTANISLLTQENTELKDKITKIQFQLDQLLRFRFGSKSERYEDAEDPQRPLFPELIDETGCKIDPNADSSATGEEKPEDNGGASNSKDKGKPPKKHYKKRLIWPEDIKVNEIIIDTPEDKCTCASCGNHLREIGKDITDVLSFTPAKFEVNREIKIKRSCGCGAGTGIIVPASPSRILPRVLIDESLLAEIAIAKCLDRQPYYHLEQRYESRHNVSIPRASMANWMIQLAKPLMPLYNLLLDQLNEYDIASLDATWLQVLKENGRKPQTKSKVWCFNGGSPETPVVIFEYNDEDHVGFIKNKLLEFKGYLHGDADNCYKNLDESKHQMVYCNAHSRRHYEPIAKAANQAGIASHMLTEYQKLYAIEAEIKATNIARAEKNLPLLTPDEIKAIRQEKAKPIFNNVKEYLDEKIMQAPPKSLIGVAMAYTIKYWSGLTKYLDDGRLSIDNNHTERIIRKFVMARNNFLFADTVEGAKALCILFSLIQSAILNGLEPYDYLVKIFKTIPHCKTVDDYIALMPWSF